MATFETSKQAVLDRINTLASSSSTTAEDSIYLAKALREAAADIAFVWRGPWTSTYTYVLGDVVQHDGNAYICINAHVAAVTFDSASGSWQTMVVGGAQWFTGNTVPANSSGEDGDWFFNSADEKIHNRQSGTWVSIADLGGSIWASSAGVGTGGEDGDFHFNETTQEISKRSSGTWTVLADLTPLSADWNATTGSSFISNKPVLSTVATSGDFNDLSNQPTPFDPDTLGDLATLNTVPSAKIDNGAVTDAKITNMAASKLQGALPAISGASLTGLATEFKNFQSYKYTGIVSFSTTASETNWWSVTFNRTSPTSDIYINSMTPAFELPNGVWVGNAMVINGFKTSRGMCNARPGSDTTMIGFNSVIKASELGTTTGNITISHMYNWGGSSDIVKPWSYLNFAGGSGGPRDPGIGTAYETEGQMVIWEIE